MSEKPKPVDLRERVRRLVDIFYDVQDVRIRTENRLRQVGEVEGVRPEELRKLEDRIRRRIEFWLRDVPIYAAFLSKVKGLGPVLAGAIVAYVDIRKAEHVSSLWKYFGLHVVDGKAARRERGKKTDFNPKLKTLAWKIGMQFLKSKNPKYAALYEEFRRREEAKLGNPVEDPTRCPLYRECSKRLKKAERPACALHIHLRALRRVVKEFLKELYVEWRKLEGLPVSEPYSARFHK